MTGPTTTIRQFRQTAELHALGPAWVLALGALIILGSIAAALWLRSRHR